MSVEPDNEYFSDGITEEIINALTKVQGLRVIARTSSFAYKNKNQDVRAIGRELDVESILEGSVRRYGDQLRVTAQLINSEDGMHYWSENFDRRMEDIFALQDEISLLIAGQVRDHFGYYPIEDELVPHQKANISAYEAYLRGRFHQLRWTPEDISKAVEYYEQSIALDDRFARAHYGAMQAYGLLAAWGYMPAEEGFGKGFNAFLRGREIDSEIPDYYMAIVGRFFWKEWDFQLAYEHIEATLEVSPTHMDALEAMAELLLLHGEFEAAESYVLRALEVDPLSGNHYYTLGNNYYMREDFSTAITHLDRALALNPELELARLLKANCYLWLKDENSFKAALPASELDELLSLLYRSVNEPDYLVDAELVMTWKDVALDNSQLVPLELFILANGQREADALRLLAQYVEGRRGQLINYRVEPFLRPLRALDEFQSLHQSTLDISLVTKAKSEEQEASQTRFEAAQLEKDVERLKELLESERLYLDAQLSLRDLADRLGVHANYLSFLINDQLKVNFNELINGLRLEAFKRSALAPDNHHLTLLALAYDSGFNSKTVFNTFFKKKEGMTPRTWLKNQS
ncbi:adenylate cyclase [Lewinellaceae bacterium SD302]|nr:adenylate cyclase [Lewinellaceae bacterium SD302]